MIIIFTLGASNYSLQWSVFVVPRWRCSEVIIYNRYLDEFQRNVVEMRRSCFIFDAYVRKSLDACHIINRKYRYYRIRSDYAGRRGCFVVVTAVACTETPAHGRPPRSPRSRVYASPFRSLHLFACTPYRTPIIALSLFRSCIDRFCCRSRT